MSMFDKSNDKSNYFGFRRVSKDDKLSMVNDVFHSVSKKYDLMNDLMSFGIHRYWKNRLIQLSHTEFGHVVLDLAGGTGDLTVKFSRLVGNSGLVILVDINNSMLELGRKKLRDLGVVNNVFYVQANAEVLPFVNNVFDCVSMSFGLRNVVDQEKVLFSIYRVIKPGGKVLILDFSKPIHKFISKIYDLYSFYILPRLGQLIAQDYDSYQYLVESIRMHPDQERLQSMMYEIGFQNVEYFNMTSGIVVLHRGYKF